MRKLIALMLLLCMLLSCAAAAPQQTNDFTAVNSVVKFGRYEQDNNTRNGQEAIEWIVLAYDSESDRALLLSRYILDTCTYDNGSGYPGWENSGIRSWLKDTFQPAAFSAEELDAIADTETVTPDNTLWAGYAADVLGWKTACTVSGGADVTDKVFLLSVEEAMTYAGFSTLDAWYAKGTNQLKGIPTKYAVAQGAYQFTSKNAKLAPDYYLDKKGTGWWWLRSPGCFTDSAAFVNLVGGPDIGSVYYPSLGVRPAVWVDVSKVK